MGNVRTSDESFIIDLKNLEEGRALRFAEGICGSMELHSSPYPNKCARNLRFCLSASELRLR